MYGKKTYVLHCLDCSRFIEKSLQYDGDGNLSKCPEDGDHTEFNKRLARGEVALPFIPDYKKGENYPQRAVNLPGEPMVSSYEDYQKKCRAAGQVETGVSNESRYRMKHKAARKNRQVYDLDPLAKKVKTEPAKPEVKTIKEPGKKALAL